MGRGIFSPILDKDCKPEVIESFKSHFVNPTRHRSILISSVWYVIETDQENLNSKLDCIKVLSQDLYNNYNKLNIAREQYWFNVVVKLNKSIDEESKSILESAAIHNGGIRLINKIFLLENQTYDKTIIGNDYQYFASQVLHFISLMSDEEVPSNNRLIELLSAANTKLFATFCAHVTSLSFDNISDYISHSLFADLINKFISDKNGAGNNVSVLDHVSSKVGTIVNVSKSIIPEVSIQPQQIKAISNIDDEVNFKNAGYQLILEEVQSKIASGLERDQNIQFETEILFDEYFNQIKLLLSENKTDLNSILKDLTNYKRNISSEYKKIQSNIRFTKFNVQNRISKKKQVIESYLGELYFIYKNAPKKISYLFNAKLILSTFTVLVLLHIASLSNIKTILLSALLSILLPWAYFYYSFTLKQKNHFNLIKNKINNINEIISEVISNLDRIENLRLLTTKSNILSEILYYIQEAVVRLDIIKKVLNRDYTKRNNGFITRYSCWEESEIQQINGTKMICDSKEYIFVDQSMYQRLLIKYQVDISKIAIESYSGKLLVNDVMKGLEVLLNQIYQELYSGIINKINHDKSILKLVPGVRFDPIINDIVNNITSSSKIPYSGYEDANKNVILGVNTRLKESLEEVISDVKNKLPRKYNLITLNNSSIDKAHLIYFVEFSNI